MSRFRRSFLASSLALVMVVSACSSDDDGSDAAATPTTLTVEQAAYAYSERGPYPVGVTTLELEGGIPVEVWYPAVEGATGTDSYDARELVPDTVTDLLTADVPAEFTYDASRDADVADGEFPLVLYSHGFSSYRQASTTLTSHLASWGMVVAAPDHWSRDLYHVFDSVLGGPEIDTNEAVDDLRFTRELLEAENASDPSRFAGRVDVSSIAAVGHSAGGGSVLELAPDDGIAGYVSMASGARLGGGANTTTSVAPPEMPDTPSLFVAGDADEVVSFEEVTRPAYDAAPEPSRLWALAGVGHNAFDDVCTFGNGAGLVGVADESGLGPLLDSQPFFRTLGQDGCLDPAPPVEDTFPIINHVVTAFLRNVFGTDPEPVGLGPEVADQYVIAVEIEQKP